MNDIVKAAGAAMALAPFEEYDGTTYYGRAQLKSAPFDNLVVGGYIFIAGTSGSAALLAALADLSGDKQLSGVVRRGRYIALLAPVLGSPLLIYDLHTPKRFYNMLRVAKATSPMSIGTWILMGFSGAAFAAAALQAASDIWPDARWMRTVARIAGLPAAAAGMGLSFYTAALMSATSTPVWAAAPRALAMRYGSSSIASAAAALTLGEDDAGVKHKLATVETAALLCEAVATAAAGRVYREKGVTAAFNGPAGRAERLGAVGLGLAVPLGIFAASLLLGRRNKRAATAAALATLTGSFILRTSMLAVGDASAERPDVSFRFSSPENLPAARVP